MRTAFIESLCEAARTNPRIWLLTADLGYSVLEVFAEEFPDRYLNVGVAEQNLVGVAAGIAHLGNTVFIYSIANFPTLRCLEQIRNDVCYHDLPVKVVSVGGGFAYGAQGYTHHGLEDIAMMRALPNMKVLAPGDPLETRQCLDVLCADDGPGYLRLGKAGEPIVHHSQPSFGFGQAVEIRPGTDVTLISTGGMLAYTVKTAEHLSSNASIHARVLSMPSLKPLDESSVRAAIRETEGIITVEEHSVTGGLGTAVAEVIAEDSAKPGFFSKFGVPDQMHRRIGSQSFLRDAVIGDLAATVMQHVKPPKQRANPAA